MEEEEEKDIRFVFFYFHIVVPINIIAIRKYFWVSYGALHNPTVLSVCLSVTVQTDMQIYILNAAFCQQRDIVNCHFIPYLEHSPTRPGTHQPCTLRINFYLLNNIRTRTVFLARSASNKLQLVKEEKKNLTGNGSLPLQCSVRSACPL